MKDRWNRGIGGETTQMRKYGNPADRTFVLNPIHVIKNIEEKNILVPGLRTKENIEKFWC